MQICRHNTPRIEFMVLLEFFRLTFVWWWEGSRGGTGLKSAFTTFRAVIPLKSSHILLLSVKSWLLLFVFVHDVFISQISQQLRLQKFPHRFSTLFPFHGDIVILSQHFIYIYHCIIYTGLCLNLKSNYLYRIYVSLIYGVLNLLFINAK